MRSRADVERLLSSETAPDRRLRVFAALLTAESGLGTTGLTVVGGSAIEIYTNGTYVSGDIDLIVADRDPVVQRLRAWGFKDEGKLWVHEQLGLFVDMVGSYTSGSERLTRVVQTDYGEVRLGAVEDLILNRLREVRYWSERKALAQAILLASVIGEDLDWEYLRWHAARDKIEDLLEVVQERAKQVRPS